MEHVPLFCFFLGDKFEQPTKGSNRNLPTEDKDAKYELLFKGNDLRYDLECELPISNAHSQGPISKPSIQDLKEGLPGLVPLGRAVEAAGRAPSKLPPQPPLL